MRLDRPASTATSPSPRRPPRSTSAACGSSPSRASAATPHAAATNQRDRSPKQLIERYARRWSIENTLAAQIRAFHLDALSSQVPLAVDLDTTLSVLCDSIYRSFARRLDNGYATATPDTIFRHFIATPGDLHVSDHGIDVRLRPRAHTPVLLDTDYHDRVTKIPWWNDRQLSYSFPPA